MKVSELKAGQGKVDVEVKVSSKEEPRTFNKYGKELRVVNAMVTDESGSIKLSLWNDDVDKVNVGDIIRITNGYVSEFNGEKQLTSGKFGKLEVVGKDDSSAEKSSETHQEHAKKGKKAKKEETDDLEEMEF